jgi:hypothetical protein
MSCCKECDYIKQLRYMDKNRAKIRVKRRESARRFRAANPGYNARACQKAKRRRMGRKIEQASSIYKEG